MSPNLQKFEGKGGEESGACADRVLILVSQRRGSPQLSVLNLC
jgi:hypothetical protein